MFRQQRRSHQKELQELNCQGSGAAGAFVETAGIDGGSTAPSIQEDKDGSGLAELGASLDPAASTKGSRSSVGPTLRLGVMPMPGASLDAEEGGMEEEFPVSVASRSSSPSTGSTHSCASSRLGGPPGVAEATPSAQNEGSHSQPAPSGSTSANSPTPSSERALDPSSTAKEDALDDRRLRLHLYPILDGADLRKSKARLLGEWARCRGVQLIAPVD